MDLNKKVTVLMPVYNAEKFLHSAIESILSQSFKDFDLLIIDDGSTDSSYSIIHSFNDSRIQYLKNEQNVGIVDTLNKGLDMIASSYIVRMDSDDWAYPNRIEKQVAFMDQHPKIAISGTSIQKFNENRNLKIINVKTDPQDIKTQLLFDNALMHPTVIMRNSVLNQSNYRYNNEHIAMEDFGLWQNVSLKHELGNLSDVLLKYRVNNEGISQQAKKDERKRDQAFINVYKHFFSLLNISLNNEELTVYRKFLSGKGNIRDKEWIKEVNSVLQKVNNHLNDSFNQHYFRNKLSQYYRINASNSNVNIFEAIRIHKNSLNEIFPFKTKEKVKFIIKNRL